jgi:hypothetical protein
MKPHIQSFVTAPRGNQREFGEQLWTNNNSESVNHIFKRAIDWKPQTKTHLFTVYLRLRALSVIFHFYITKHIYIYITKHNYLESIYVFVLSLLSVFSSDRASFPLPLCKYKCVLLCKYEKWLNNDFICFNYVNTFCI